MATWPTPSLSDGYLVAEGDWNLHVDNLNDLNTRVGTGNGTALSTRVSTLETGKVPNTRTITTASTSGLTGGGDLSANRSLAVNFGDTATTVATGLRALNLETRATALESGRALNKYGRWYSTSTAVHDTSTVPITSWVADGTPMTDVSVSGSTFTVNTTGLYEMTAQYHGTMNETQGTGGNTNFFIAKVDLTALYAQSQGYRVQYQAGAIEVSDNISTGAVSLTAGTTFNVTLGSATPVGITLSNSLKRTFISIRRIA